MSMKLFVVSSTESLPVARRIPRLLSSRDIVVTLWNNYLTQPGEFHLDALIRATDEFDFAVFMFSPDDMTRIRNKDVFSVREM
jgi:predicted nucleotide-binding protein